ncbi:hypothetical protein JW977_00955 [Candidatus Falkowbacteria bacterium]|nr:hypothetical protein [Candidatus Falkowbacteria bacterium]
MNCSKCNKECEALIPIHISIHFSSNGYKNETFELCTECYKKASKSLDYLGVGSWELH